MFILVKEKRDKGDDVVLSRVLNREELKKVTTFIAQRSVVGREREEYSRIRNIIQNNDKLSAEDVSYIVDAIKETKVVYVDKVLSGAVQKLEAKKL